jgi:hypothetical protein
MFDLHCKDPNQMHYPALATRSRYFKEDEEGVRKMCKAMEEMRSETAIETSSKIAISLLNDNMPVEIVAKHTGLPLVLVEKLANEQKDKKLPN